MLVSRDYNPCNHIYYLGGIIIKKLKKYNKGSSIDFFELHRAVCKIRIISVQQYIFALDWLYMLKLVEIDSQGNIKKCF